MESKSESWEAKRVREGGDRLKGIEGGRRDRGKGIERIRGKEGGGIEGEVLLYVWSMTWNEVPV